MKPYTYSLAFKVRDYECDLQGIVNNSVYMNYLEHTRHEFIKLHQLDFYQLSLEGILPVVYEAHLKFKHSLKSGDAFFVKLRVRKEGFLKIVFEEDIYRESDNLLMLKAEITTVVTKNNRPIPPDETFKTLLD